MFDLPSGLRNPHACAAGGVVNGDQELGSGVLSQDEWDAVFQALPLTDREQDVLLRLFDQMGEQAIANELGISISTVRKYIRSIYLKLDVNCRMGLSLRIWSIWMAQNGFGNRSSLEQGSVKRGP